jgi:hypothetical protein
MRYKIWITLIVCGTLIALAPPLSDYLFNHQVQRMLIERKDFNSMSFGTPLMSSEYRFGCWALGGAMIAVGTIGGRRESDRRADDEV